MLGYLSADIICSEKRTVFRERSSRKTVSFEEQIMSKDKYPSIFSPQMEAIVFIILQIFFATRAVLKIGVYSRISPSFSWGIFCHVTCLDQSRASEKIWWIIISNVRQLCLTSLTRDFFPEMLSISQASQTHDSRNRSNIYGLLTKCVVKMAGYWPSSFFACLWTEMKSRSLNSQKKNEANI